MSLKTVHILTLIEGDYIVIKGRPDLSSVVTMMVGVRNIGSDDREPKSVCLWANEPRSREIPPQMSSEEIAKRIKGVDNP